MMSARLARMPERIKPCAVSVALLVACGAADAPDMGAAGRDGADSHTALVNAGSDLRLQSNATAGQETVRIVNERFSHRNLRVGSVSRVGGPEYDGAVRAFAEAMRQVDPSIRVLSSFPSADTLRSSGGYLDYLCPHHYGCADLAAMAESFASLEQQNRQFAGNRPVRIAVTEWNTTAADWDLGRASLQTLQNALSCSRYHNLMHRHADSVEIAVRSNLIDSFGSGVVLTGPGWLYCAPTYYAQCLYARAWG